MGLLGNLDFSTGDPLTDYGLIGGLLTARVGDNRVPQLLFSAAQAKQQQQNQERLNRANDLQQLQGAYSMLKQQEFAKMLAAKQQGVPYSPNPMLPQMEAKLGELTGLNNLSGKLGPAPAAAAPIPRPAPMAAPGMAPASTSPMANPDYQPSAQAVQQRQQAPQVPQQQPQSDDSGLGGPAGGIPVEAWLAMDSTGKAYMDQLAKDNAPQNVRPGGSLAVKGPDGKYNAAFYAPLLTPGVMPQRDRSGNVTGALQIPGFADAASAIKGAEARSAQAGKQAETYVDVPIGNGQTKRMTNAQYQALLSGQAIPPEVMAADRSGAPFNATQAPNGPVQFQRGGPTVASLTVTQPPSAGSGAGFGGLGVTPNPVAQAGAIADVQAGAKNRQGVMKDDYASLAAQNANAQTVISRLQTIKQLGPQAITGAQTELRDFYNGLLTLVGIKGANDAKTAGDLIDKNAAQIALAIGSGSNGTDALRSLAQIANPSRHMTEDAMGKAVDSLVAPLQMTQVKTQLLTPHFTSGNQANYFAQKQAFERAADPRIWELQSLQPQQQKAYINSLSPADAQHLLAARNVLRQMGALQ